MQNQNRNIIWGSVIIGLGLALGGMFAGEGLVRARTAERIVTVKGLAEREVQAGLAIWPLRLSVSDNDLARGHAKLAADVGRIKAFLSRNGIDTAATELQDFSVTDAFANQYAPQGGIASRYVIRQTVMVRSNDPENILRASQRIGELVAGGVVFSSGNEYGGGGPTFIFNGLGDLKPKMIAEATAQARAAAEQFARDSKSKIAGIRRANQGLFEIRPRDEANGVREESQINKTVRVVATVEYLLK
jgi:hypothetical protein